MYIEIISRLKCDFQEARNTTGGDTEKGTEMDSDVEQLVSLYDDELSEGERAMQKRNPAVGETPRVVESVRRSVTDGEESKIVRGAYKEAWRSEIHRGHKEGSSPAISTSRNVRRRRTWPARTVQSIKGVFHTEQQSRLLSGSGTDRGFSSNAHASGPGVLVSRCSLRQISRRILQPGNGNSSTRRRYTLRTSQTRFSYRVQASSEYICRT